MFTLDADADLDGLVASLRRLPELIDEIRSYEVLADAGLAEGNAHVAVIGTFDDEAGWGAYLEHPEHQAVVLEQIRPHLVARTGAAGDGLAGPRRHEGLAVGHAGDDQRPVGLPVPSSVWCTPSLPRYSGCSRTIDSQSATTTSPRSVARSTRASLYSGPKLLQPPGRLVDDGDDHGAPRCDGADEGLDVRDRSGDRELTVHVVGAEPDDEQIPHPGPGSWRSPPRSGVSAPTATETPGGPSPRDRRSAASGSRDGRGRTPHGGSGSRP